MCCVRELVRIVCTALYAEGQAKVGPRIVVTPTLDCHHEDDTSGGRQGTWDVVRGTISEPYKGSNAIRVPTC